MKSLLDKLGQLLGWALYYFLRKHSIEFRFKIVVFIAITYYKIRKSVKKRIMQNIALIRPDLDDHEIEDASLLVVKTIAWSWAAMLGNEYITQEEIMQNLKAEGIDPLLNCYRENRRIVAAAVHTGPVDKMGGVVPLFRLKVYAPAEAIKPDWLFKLMLRLRLEFQGFTFDKVERGMTLDRARHNLRSGKIVLLLVDALSEDKSGVDCRIGNARFKVKVGAIKLAIEEDAVLFPILPSWDEESDGFGVKIVVGAPFELIRTGDARRDIELNTRRLIEEVFAPHIQRNFASWQRLLWSRLKPVEAHEQLDLSDPVKRIMMRTKFRKRP